MPQPRRHGGFVVLEGGDGSGKTGALSHLAAVLAPARPGLVVTREPGGTPEGQAIRGLLLAGGGHDWLAGAELLLVAAARVQHVARVIRPALAEGRLVLCDRFVGSTLAYQGAGRGLPVQDILALHAMTTGDLWPDLTVVLDVDPEIARARSLARLRAEGSNEDRFERLGLDFHRRVREGFLDQARTRPCYVVIDASRPSEQVQRDVLTAVLAAGF